METTWCREAPVSRQYVWLLSCWSEFIILLIKNYKYEKCNQISVGKLLQFMFQHFSWIYGPLITDKYLQTLAIKLKLSNYSFKTLPKMPSKTRLFPSTMYLFFFFNRSTGLNMNIDNFPFDNKSNGIPFGS